MRSLSWAVGGWLLALAAPSWAEAGEQRPLQRIAFGSCAHEDKPQPIWQAVVAAKPDLFLFLGDNVYGDTKDMDLLRTKYAKLAAVPGYQKLQKTCPILATWDDHDYGANDAGADYPKKAESQQIFLDFFGEARDSPRRQQEGIYHARVFGPADQSVQVILLDTRYFRGPLKKRFRFLPFEGPYEPNPDPTSTMLGEAQWQWLEQQLRVPAKVRLLVSSIQVVAEDHHHEKWLNLPQERDRLFGLLRETKTAGVVILSGDRHLGELSMMDAGIGYPLYDLTSSGLNMAALKWRRLEVNRHRVATMNHAHNFGLVTIDWGRPDPLLGLQIRDEEGDIAIQEKMPLSLLQPGQLRTKSTGQVRLADGTPLTLDQIKNNLKKEIKLVMVVRATGQSKNGLIFLNSAENRLSDDNFTVVLDQKAQAQLQAAGIAAPRNHFAGRTIAVTGTLSLFQDRPQIIVSDPKQIQIVAKTNGGNPVGLPQDFGVRHRATGQIAALAQEKDAKKDLAKFQGNWSLISAERDGKKMLPEEVQKIKLIIQANKFVLLKDAMVISEGTFRLDVARKPKEIDETVTAGPNKGKVFLAIYEIDDDQHKICFAAAGKERPTAFSSFPGSGHLLQVWKRDKK